MKTFAYYIGSLIFALIAAMVIFAFVFPQPADSQALSGGINAADCDIVATSSVSIGNQSSTVVLAPRSRRAYAMISQPQGATNTVSLNFGSTAPATLTSGFPLASGEASNTPDRLIIGLNTPFPMTATVTAITNVGSTTLRVVDCVY